MLIGQEVTLNDMLLCRERRAQYQQQLLSQYHCPVISFCLNIPGPVKTNGELRKVFDLGKEKILELIAELGLSTNDSIEIHEKTGDEFIVSVSAEAVVIKNHTTEIEENHKFGRLFDIDVLDQNGVKLSRTSYRKCFVCDCQAQECARSRKHTLEELLAGVEGLLN